MKYAILIAFFSFVLSARPANAQTETLFLQQFTLADGSVLHAKISTTSLEYLYERNQAPDYVWQNFGNLWSIVKVSALFWKAEILLGSWAFANGKASHWTCFKLTAR